jgi:hypothetical protein
MQQIMIISSDFEITIGEGEGAAESVGAGAVAIGEGVAPALPQPLIASVATDASAANLTNMPLLIMSPP